MFISLVEKPIFEAVLLVLLGLLSESDAAAGCVDYEMSFLFFDTRLMDEGADYLNALKPIFAFAAVFE